MKEQCNKRIDRTTVDEDAILSAPMNHLCTDQFRSRPNKIAFKDPAMAQALQLRTCEDSIQDLIDCMWELQSKDRSFAFAAAVDTVRAFETLLKQHSNISDEAMQIAGSAFSSPSTMSVQLNVLS